MVEVYYATNRNLDGGGKFGEGFNPEGPDYLRFGWADVTRVNDDDYKIKSFKVAREQLGEDKKTIRGSAEVFERMRKRMIKDRADVLCVIHGYASTFDAAIERVAELADNYSTKERPLIGFVFSWPANGEMVPFMSYKSDRSDARNSGPAIARAFGILCDFVQKLAAERRCEQRIHLLAHSMGNWALRHALDDIIVNFNDQPPRLFDHVFLMAADEDNDTLEDPAKLGRLPEICRRVHVYFSEDDRALMISDTTKFNPDRLGATGPRNRLLVSHKIDAIDCSLVDEPDRKRDVDAKRWDLSVHQYYRLRQEVIDDVRQVIAGVIGSQIVGREFLADQRCYRIMPHAGAVRPERPQPSEAPQ